MSNLQHLFKKDQMVKCRLDENIYDGTVKEVFPDHIIVDVPEISDHCYFDDCNIGCVYPEYNF